MQTIAVTGGAGFIGSHVVDALLQLGNKVICIDNFNDYYDPNRKEKNIDEAKKNPNFILERVDITDKQALKTIFDNHKIEVIIHLAARAGVRPSMENPELYHKVNVEGTKNILEIAVQHKCQQVIYGSSSSVYGTNQKVPFSEEDEINNFISPYAETKKKAEELCKQYHKEHQLNITCLRFFTVYGPRGRPDMAPYKFTKNILEGKPITQFGDGSSKRDYTFIDDIKEGILQALQHPLPFEIINLGNSKTISLTEFIHLIEKVTEKKAIIQQQPTQKGDVPITYADMTKAKNLLNFSTSTSVEEGLQKFIEWYKHEQ